MQNDKAIKKKLVETFGAAIISRDVIIIPALGEAAFKSMENLQGPQRDRASGTCQET
jgi:hypothetical protein